MAGDLSKLYWAFQRRSPYLTKQTYTCIADGCIHKACFKRRATAVSMPKERHRHVGKSFLFYFNRISHQ